MPSLVRYWEAKCVSMCFMVPRHLRGLLLSLVLLDEVEAYFVDRVD